MSKLRRGCGKIRFAAAPSELLRKLWHALVVLGVTIIVMAISIITVDAMHTPMLMSDTTNLAPAMAGTDVMSHVKFMLLPTGITYGICLLVFLILGFTGAGGTADMAQTHALGDAIHDLFTIHPILLLQSLLRINRRKTDEVSCAGLFERASRQNAGAAHITASTGEAAVIFRIIQMSS